jgi:hypothetical protein
MCWALWVGAFLVHCGCILLFLSLLLINRGKK